MEASPRQSCAARRLSVSNPGPLTSERYALHPAPALPTEWCNRVVWWSGALELLQRRLRTARIVQRTPHQPSCLRVGIVCFGPHQLGACVRQRALSAVLLGRSAAEPRWMPARQASRQSPRLRHSSHAALVRRGASWERSALHASASRHPVRPHGRPSPTSRAKEGSHVFRACACSSRRTLESMRVSRRCGQGASLGFPLANTKHIQHPQRDLSHDSAAHPRRYTPVVS